MYDDQDGRGPYRRLPLHAQVLGTDPGSQWRNYDPNTARKGIGRRQARVCTGSIDDKGLNRDGRTRIRQWIDWMR